MDEENAPPEDHANRGVTIAIALHLLTVPIFFLDPCGGQSDRNRNAKRTRHLMMAVLISNICFSVWYTIMTTACGPCNVMRALVFSNRTVSRGINMMFLVHRAKLVQGMTPILSKKWFEKIIPVTIAVWMGLMILCFAPGQLAKEFECIPYVDSEIFQSCWDPKLKEMEESTAVFIVILIVVSIDLIMTTIVLCLFVVPLYRVYRVDFGRMNENQLRQRQKLKQVLIWSVILTFTNQATSYLWFSNTSGTSDASLAKIIMGSIGVLDPPINVWSSWLMVTRNRQKLQKICCCKCCYRSEEDSRRARRSTVAISNVSSRTNSRQFSNIRMRKLSTIESPVPSLLPMDKDQDDSKAESMLQT